MPTVINGQIITGTLYINGTIIVRPGFKVETPMLIASTMTTSGFNKRDKIFKKDLGLIDGHGAAASSLSLVGTFNKKLKILPATTEELSQIAHSSIAVTGLFKKTAIINV